MICSFKSASVITSPYSLSYQFTRNREILLSAASGAFDKRDPALVTLKIKQPIEIHFSFTAARAERAPSDKEMLDRF
jgi:hypothetical protein